MNIKRHTVACLSGVFFCICIWYCNYWKGSEHTVAEGEMWKEKHKNYR